jgi:hypothetical protein
MEVIHARRAGLDVHKDTVWCACEFRKNRSDASGENIWNHNERTASAERLVVCKSCDVRGYGGGRRVLEAGLACAGSKF